MKGANDPHNLIACSRKDCHAGYVPVLGKTVGGEREHFAWPCGHPLLTHDIAELADQLR
jgi:hypothetical protein